MRRFKPFRVIVDDGATTTTFKDQNLKKVLRIIDKKYHGKR